MLLAVPSGIIAFMVSRGAVWLSTSLIFATVPKSYVEYIHIIPLDADGRVLAFMMIAALGAAVMFGLVPALHATRPNIVQASRGDFDTQFRPSRMRNALVVAQVPLSVLLLITAGVLLSSARRTATMDPGVRTKNVLQLVLLPRVREKALDVLQHDRNVLSVASSSSTALDGTFSEVMLSPSGAPAQRASYNVVSPSYFAVLDLPMLIGRGFTEDEARSRAAVAIVSQSTAERFWPGKNPIGETLSIPPTDRDFAYLEAYHASRVIGVTRDASPGVLVKSPTTPTVYFPLPLEANVNQVIARVGGASDRAQATLEQSLAAVDSAAVVEIHSLEESLTLQVYPFQAMYWVASALGVIALLLTLTGVYGVLSYVVAQRRREFGIRLALGAGGPSLIALIMRQSLGLSVKGILIGVPMALAVSRLFASLLFNVDTYDAPGYIIGVGIVLVTCLGAAYAPSRRAASVDPVETLRADS
jgi:predicted permease